VRRGERVAAEIAGRGDWKEQQEKRGKKRLDNQPVLKVNQLLQGRRKKSQEGAVLKKRREG